MISNKCYMHKCLLMALVKHCVVGVIKLPLKYQLACKRHFKRFSFWVSLQVFQEIVSGKSFQASFVQKSLFFKFWQNVFGISQLHFIGSDTTVRKELKKAAINICNLTVERLFRSRPAVCKKKCSVDLRLRVDYVEKTFSFFVRVLYAPCLIKMKLHCSFNIFHVSNCLNFKTVNNACPKTICAYFKWNIPLTL